MKRFVKQLLPLGALLAVAAMPIQAAAADQPKADLNELLKTSTCYSNPSNTYLNQANCKWPASCEEIDCKELLDQWLGNLQKPNCPQPPDKPIVPDVPSVPDKPIVPDVPSVPDKPIVPDVPSVPDKPIVPDVPSVPEKPEQPDNGGGGSQLSGYEQQVVDQVNKERAAAGLSALKVNTKLAGVAEKKAEDMRDKGYFSHTSPTYGSPFDMMKQFGINYKSAGENIAKGQKTPQSVMNGWMNSQGHKENILSSKYTEIGVGYVTDAKGNTYWVQMFIRP